MIQLMHTNFIKPYYIEILGEEGLTARDIARALNVEIKHIHEKIKRDLKLQDSVFIAVSYTITIELNTYNEKEMTTYAFPTNSAKAFIARWKNKVGDSYLKFLFDCEKVATEITPKLIEQIKELQTRIEYHETNAIKRDKKLLKATKKGQILAPIYEKGQIFDVIELRWEMRQKETLDEVTKLKAIMKHQQKIISGLSEKILKNSDILEKEELNKSNKKILKLLDFVKTTEI